MGNPAPGTIYATNAYLLWDDLQLLTAARNGASAPTMTVYRGTIYGPEFTATGTNEFHGSIELPHTYAEGTDMKLHVHWKTNSTNAAGGGVVWGMEYTFTTHIPGSVEPAPTTLQATESVAASNQQYLQHSFDIGTISGVGRKVSDLLKFRIYRLGNDGADTFAASCYPDSFAIHYQKDTNGSISEKVKP